MKKTILKSVLFCMAAFAFHSQAMAKVEEIVVKNNYEKTVMYNTANGRTDELIGGYPGNVNGSTIARFYQKFTLPEYIAGTTLSSATLNFSYQNSLGSGRSLQLLGTTGDWSASINWYTQPVPTTDVLGLIPPSYRWKNDQIDVTDYINNAYQSGNSIGFLIRSSAEGSNWTDAGEFARGQILNLTFTSAVPEPETYAMLLMGLGLIGIIGRRKRA